MDSRYSTYSSRGGRNLLVTLIMSFRLLDDIEHRLYGDSVPVERLLTERPRSELLDCEAGAAQRLDEVGSAVKANMIALPHQSPSIVLARGLGHLDRPRQRQQDRHHGDSPPARAKHSIKFGECAMLIRDMLQHVGTNEGIDGFRCQWQRRERSAHAHAIHSDVGAHIAHSRLALQPP